jgi:hypothetical protein
VGRTFGDFWVDIITQLETDCPISGIGVGVLVRAEPNLDWDNTTKCCTLGGQAR